MIKEQKVAETGGMKVTWFIVIILYYNAYVIKEHKVMGLYWQDCLAKMDNAQKQDLFDNCVYDSCHLNDFETVICTHGASMAMVCQNQLEVTVTWRSPSLCREFFVTEEMEHSMGNFWNLTNILVQTRPEC